MKPYANILSGVLGGLIVLVAGAILIATDVIDTGDEKTVVEGTPISRPASDTQPSGRTVADIYRREGRGVVFVRAEGVSGGSSLLVPGQATGSGFVVSDDGTIVTNAHVVEGSNDVSVRFDEDAEFVEAEVKGRDLSTDLAVLKVDPGEVEELTPLPLGDSSGVEVGDPVVAIGNPFGFTRTVTTGIVSAKQREIQAPNKFQIEDVIQTDASVNPGNSGGPLLDAEGRVIGINSQIATGGSSGSVGIAFAVPINTAKELLPELRRGGEIERPWLGVRMGTVDESVADELGLSVDRGALLDEVTEDGPADDAGLRARTSGDGNGAAAGDVIVAIDGRRVETSENVVDIVASHEPGDTIEVEYYRGDSRRSAKVELGERPDDLAATEGGSQDDVFPLP